ncbi:MerR family DNA-binding transcriptional regulator [Dermatophilus congolensis]
MEREEMKIGDLALRAGVTVKALRYYESLGLLSPGRSENGYRVYSERDFLVTCEIRHLASCGIPPSRVRPFIECLDSGNEYSDDCPEAARLYEETMVEIERVMGELTRRHATLGEHLRRREERRLAAESSSLGD